jgi:hypothetical protein
VCAAAGKGGVGAGRRRGIHVCACTREQKKWLRQSNSLFSEHGFRKIYASGNAAAS